MKRILGSVLTAALISSSISIAPITSHAATIEDETAITSITDMDKYENNDVIVVYKNEKNATSTKTLRICGLSQGTTDTTNVTELTDTSVVLKLDSKEELKTAVETLSKDSRVAYVQPNYIYQATDIDNTQALENLSANPDFNNQWGLYNDGTLTYDETDYTSTNDNYWNFPWLFSQGNVSTEAYKREYNTITHQASARVDIGLPEALSICDEAKREVVVAIVDTGVKYDHPDLQDKMWINSDEIAGDGIDNDENGYIDDIHGWNFYDENSSSSIFDRFFPGTQGEETNGNNTYYNKNSTIEDAHGTHGAGTIVAKNDSTGIVGIAANADVKIMCVKTLGGDYGYGTTESVVKGIQYAQANGAHICNLSLGGEEDDATLRSVIENSPMLFTIAAGNGDSNYQGIDNDKSPTYPASYTYDNILTVANLQCDGKLHTTSNYGATTVHIAAPGAYIYSTSTAAEGYEYMTGSSMSAPMVAGVAAMLYSCYDNLSILEVKNIILQSTTYQEALAGKCTSNGYLDAAAAVYYAKYGTRPDSSLKNPVPNTPLPSATATTKPTPVATIPGANTPTVSTPDANGSTPTTTPSYSKPTPNILHPDVTTPTITEPANVTPTPTVTTPANVNPTPTTTISDNGNTTPTAPADDIKNYTFISLDALEISGSLKKNVGQTYTISTEVSGGIGEYNYSFIISKNGKVILSKENIPNSSIQWTPDTAGDYLIRVMVSCDGEDYDYAVLPVTILKMKITGVNKNKALKKGNTVKLTAKTSAGVSPITYHFTIKKGSYKKTKSTTKKYINWKIPAKGKYTLTVKATDACGNVSKKTVTLNVKK